MARAEYRLAEAIEDENEIVIDEAPVDPDDVPSEVEVEVAPADQLLELINTPNIAVTLTEQEVVAIAHRVVEDYETDKNSRKDWEERTKDAMDLAMMVSTPKDYPFAGASNVKWPLVTQAALQFNARAYPAIVQGDRVAKVKTYGKDPQGTKAARAERVAEHLSWQLTAEIPEWEPDMDRLLVILPIIGCDFKKTYYDPALGRKCTRRVSASRFVINYFARSIEDAPRFTEELMLYPRDIEERIRDGRFMPFEYGVAQPNRNDETPGGVDTGDTDDDDAPHLFLEQHRLLDLDGDGYKEPYIVTVHKDSDTVCRIVANYTMETVRVTSDGKVAAIRPQSFFTKYEFLPSPDGGFYGMGLGWLLRDTNESINSTINQLFDAAHLNNIQGGFVNANAGIRAGTEIRVSHGKFKVLNTSMPLNQAIMPFTYQPPSEALFKLLGLLIEYGNDLASIKDVMTGETGGKVMQPTTVLALIEQGMKVFNAIFKRVHRSIRAELGIHGRLNRENVTPEQYNAFFDDPEQQYDPQADYDDKDMDLLPVSDPTVSTRMQALAKAQVAREIGAGKPWINQMELDKRAFEAAEIEDIDGLFVPPPAPDPAQQAFMQAMQTMTLAEGVEKIVKMQSETIKNLAEAESKEAGQQLTLYDAFARYLQQGHNMESNDNAAAVQGGPGGLPAMEGAPPDAMGVGLPQGGGGGVPAPAGTEPVQPIPSEPGNVGVPAA